MIQQKIKCINCNKEIIRIGIRKSYKNKFCSNKCSNNFYDKNHRELRRLNEKIRRDKIKPNRKIRIETKIKKSKSKEERNEYRKKWKEKNPEKHKKILKTKHLRERANSIKRNAWSNDYKKRKEQCSLCRSSLNLQFHHINYEEHRGVTLCLNCHRKLHLVKKNFERRLTNEILVIN